MKVSMSRKADYAVRASLYLARSGGDGRHKAREIAAATEIPANFAPQVLGKLIRAGLLRSTAGPDGGYELARTPEDISLAAIVEAVEGPPQTTRCVMRDAPCGWRSSHCAVHEHWMAAQQALIDRLAETSLAAVLASSDAAEVAG